MCVSELYSSYIMQVIKTVNLWILLVDFFYLVSEFAIFAPKLKKYIYLAF